MSTNIPTAPYTIAPNSTSSAQTQQQAQDVSQINADSQKLNTDIANGDKKAIRQDKIDLRQDFREAKHDGFSKKELKHMGHQVTEESFGAQVAGHLKAGGKPDDKQTRAFINNAYARFCRANGIHNGARNEEAKKSFAANVSAGMAQQGVSQADIEAALTPSENDRHGRADGFIKV